MKWCFQEWWLEWSLWGLGYQYEKYGGWEYNTLTIFIGPIRLYYLGEASKKRSY